MEGRDSFTTSLWIDAETLAHFYSLCQNNNASGMRIYFARYDGNYADPVRDATVGGDVHRKTTAVLVSTIAAFPGHNDYYFYDAANKAYAGLYNYNDPCPPASCDGTTLDDVVNASSSTPKK